MDEQEIRRRFEAMTPEQQEEVRQRVLAATRPMQIWMQNLARAVNAAVKPMSEAFARIGRGLAPLVQALAQLELERQQQSRRQMKLARRRRRRRLRAYRRQYGRRS